MEPAPQPNNPELKARDALLLAAVVIGVLLAMWGLSLVVRLLPPREVPQQTIEERSDSGRGLSSGERGA